MKKLIVSFAALLLVFSFAGCSQYDYSLLYWQIMQQQKEEANKPTYEEAAAIGGEYIDAFDMGGISTVASSLIDSFDIDAMTLLNEYAPEIAAAAGCTEAEARTKLISTFAAIKIGKSSYGSIDKDFLGKAAYALIEGGKIPEILTTSSEPYTLTVDDVDITLTETSDLQSELTYILSGVLEPDYEADDMDGLTHKDDTKFEFEAPVAINATLSISELDSGLFTAGSGYSAKGDFEITVNATLCNKNPYGDTYVKIDSVSMSSDGPITMVSPDGASHEVSLDGVEAELGWIIGEGNTTDVDWNGKFIKEILGGTLTIDGRTVDFKDAVLQSSDAGVVTE